VNSCVSVGTKKGFKIFNCDPFGKCYENGINVKERYFNCNALEDGGAGICEMLFASSLVAISGIGEPSTFSPRKLRILNTKVHIYINGRVNQLLSNLAANCCMRA
jgi:autophagy-related protein 18